LSGWSGSAPCLPGRPHQNRARDACSPRDQPHRGRGPTRLSDPRRRVPSRLITLPLGGCAALTRPQVASITCCRRCKVGALAVDRSSNPGNPGAFVSLLLPPILTCFPLTCALVLVWDKGGYATPLGPCRIDAVKLASEVNTIVPSPRGL